MNCRRIDELIPLYVGGDLDEHAAGDVQSHLQSCEACRGLAAEYEASQVWLRAAEPPNFDDAFVDTIRAGVLRELAARETAPPFVERLREWFAPRRLVVATAALVLIFAVVLVFIYSSRPRVDRQDQQAGDYQPVPDVEKPQPDLKSAPGANQTVPRHIRRQASPRLRLALSRHRPEATPAAPVDASTAASQGAEMLRIELQTSDPNIRIIWFTSNPADREALNPMDETR
jgi:Putative zinc-finger